MAADRRLYRTVWWNGMRIGGSQVQYQFTENIECMAKQFTVSFHTVSGQITDVSERLSSLMLERFFFLADDTFPLASALWRHITNKTDYMWSNLNSLDWSHILVSSIVNTTSLSANVILIKLNLSAITHGVKYFTKPLIIYSAVLTRDTL